MKGYLDRRRFLGTTAVAAAGLTLAGSSLAFRSPKAKKGKRVGIIGLDTSHAIAFTKAFNAAEPDPALKGFRVVAAYPHGSSVIKSSYSRIPKYTKQVEEMGVKVVDSISKLLKMCDVVLLETNDGTLHLEQAVQVMRAGKTLFIDKPVSAVLADAVAIYDLAKKYGVPLFSSSSLRYTESAQQAAHGAVGTIVGATTYGPAELEEHHTDLYWYGIHAVELMYTVMGRGCVNVTRTSTPTTDVVVGVWQDERVGTMRGTRSGIYEFGGTAFGEKKNISLGGYSGYKPLLLEIAKFFETGISPVPAEETLELYGFMAAADVSKQAGGSPVSLKKVMDRAREEAVALKKKY